MNEESMDVEKILEELSVEEKDPNFGKRIDDIGNYARDEKNRALLKPIIPPLVKLVLNDEYAKQIFRLLANLCYFNKENIELLFSTNDLSKVVKKYLETKEVGEVQRNVLVFLQNYLHASEPVREKYVKGGFVEILLQICSITLALTVETDPFQICYHVYRALGNLLFSKKAVFAFNKIQGEKTVVASIRKYAPMSTQLFNLSLEIIQYTGAGYDNDSKNLLMNLITDECKKSGWSTALHKSTCVLCKKQFKIFSRYGIPEFLTKRLKGCRQNKEEVDAIVLTLVEMTQNDDSVIPFLFERGVLDEVVFWFKEEKMERNLMLLLCNLAKTTNEKTLGLIMAKPEIQEFINAKLTSSKDVLLKKNCITTISFLAQTDEAAKTLVKCGIFHALEKQVLRGVEFEKTKEKTFLMQIESDADMRKRLGFTLSKFYADRRRDSDDEYWNVLAEVAKNVIPLMVSTDAHMFHYYAVAILVCCARRGKWEFSEKVFARIVLFFMSDIRPMFLLKIIEFLLSIVDIVVDEEESITVGKVLKEKKDFVAKLEQVGAATSVKMKGSENEKNAMELIEKIEKS